MWGSWLAVSSRWSLAGCQRRQLMALPWAPAISTPAPARERSREAAADTRKNNGFSQLVPLTSNVAMWQGQLQTADRGMAAPSSPPQAQPTCAGRLPGVYHTDAAVVAA